ncbi:hypothetical protein AOCH_003978 [Aspergillus ochraceoroseus]|uniref:Protein FYV10 n=1 Tax=Aspergillus ochraceoroseus TaxID=138278 RepID=A0A0F8VNP0_9EURO|nr:hypothetical protein AOCH_003978 [Aspergillus ochraceoroseus]
MPIVNVVTSFPEPFGWNGSLPCGRNISPNRRLLCRGRIVRRRLLETLQHVPQVSLSLDGMKPGGAGHKSSARVRLLPSLVQSGILNLVKEKPEYYNVDEYGILINYLDCLATINTFSRADLEVFDLANIPPSYTPSSAPDHPNLPIPLDPTPSHPSPDSASGGTPSSTHQESILRRGIPGAAEPSSSSLRRRRRSLSSTSESASVGTGSRVGGYTAREAGFQEQSTVQASRAPSEGYFPSSKRRRLANMRPDGISSTNGSSQVSKGSVASPSQKTALHTLNGQATYAAPNGEFQTNGSQKLSLNAPYFGHDREELTRILIQSLYELGYSGSAALLSKESGYQLESPAVTIFRHAVLEGRWTEAERILVQSFYPPGHGRARSGADQTASKENLILMDSADKNEMLFYLRQQKFLELLDARNLAAALMSPHVPPEHLHDQAGWDGPIGSSRERLLAELSKSISPSVMIPDNRLATLLDHVKQNQINQCLYHNTAASPSLYSDHMCDRNDFPLGTKLELNQHSDEVWHCQFSHDGTKLVTAGRDNSVIIYDTSTFAVLHKLMEHEAGVAHAVWSPDDSKLITCSQDRTARVWSAETGRCLLTINHHRQPVTAAVWAPDGESFVTASLDVSSQLCHWSIRGQPLHMWPGGFRVQDCAITPDGRRLIAVDVDKKIRVFNFITHEEEYTLPLKSKATSIVVSRDSRQMLVNLTECQIQLIDIDTTEVIRRFQGQKQSMYIIRSTFGGAAENFVVSGNSRIYVWHKENGTLVETLDGHVSGCVNAISWNPADPGMFASAGDDCLVKIWTRERDIHPTGTPGKHRAVSGNSYARTSALRSTSSF